MLSTSYKGRIILNTSDLDINITSYDISRMLTEDMDQRNVGFIMISLESFMFIQGLLLAPNYIGITHIWNTKLLYHSIYLMRSTICQQYLTLKVLQNITSMLLG